MKTTWTLTEWKENEKRKPNPVTVNKTSKILSAYWKNKIRKEDYFPDSNVCCNDKLSNYSKVLINIG